MDIIFIEELRIPAWIGVYPREQALPQTVEITLHIGTHTAQAGQSDALGDTIDYGAVTARLREELATHRFSLLEALAEHIATLLQDVFGARWVRVSVSKPGILRDVRRVGVRIERGECAERHCQP